MRESLREYCLWAGREDLLAQWDREKNGALTPETVAAGSHRKVWWRCGKGHRWQAMVKSRVTGCGCPVCAHRVVQPGENDLASAYPDLAEQWNWERNGGLTPRDVFAGAQRKVWWRCGKGHEWQARISARTYGGSGCPYCTGKRVKDGENDLASVYPELAKQWHPTRNGGLTPREVTPHSNRKVWWVCPLGHDYQAVVATRTSHHSGCPYCAGRKALPGFNDLAALVPEVAAQWHPTLNGTLTPDRVTTGSHKRVWWLCPLGHTWRAVVYARARGRRCGCPVCAGTVKQDPDGTDRRLRERS